MLCSSKDYMVPFAPAVSMRTLLSEVSSTWDPKREENLAQRLSHIPMKKSPILHVYLLESIEIDDFLRSLLTIKTMDRNGDLGNFLISVMNNSPSCTSFPLCFSGILALALDWLWRARIKMCNWFVWPRGLPELWKHTGSNPSLFWSLTINKWLQQMNSCSKCLGNRYC